MTQMFAHFLTILECQPGLDKPYILWILGKIYCSPVVKLRTYCRLCTKLLTVQTAMESSRKNNLLLLVRSRESQFQVPREDTAAEIVYEHKVDVADIYILKVYCSQLPAYITKKAKKYFQI